jgi:hypothetical protein
VLVCAMAFFGALMRGFVVLVVLSAGSSWLYAADPRGVPSTAEPATKLATEEFEAELLHAQSAGLIQPMTEVLQKAPVLEVSEAERQIQKLVDDYANGVVPVESSSEMFNQAYRTAPQVLGPAVGPQRYRALAARVLVLQTILAIVAKAKGGTDAVKPGFFEKSIAALRGLLNVGAISLVVHEYWHATAGWENLQVVGTFAILEVCFFMLVTVEGNSWVDAKPPQKKFLYKLWAGIGRTLDKAFALPRRVFSRGAPHQRRLAAYAIAKLEARGLIDAGSSKRLLNALLKNASAGAARACDANLLPPSRLLK